MILFFLVSLALSLMVLTGGTALWIWSARDNQTGASFGRIIGLVVIIISLLLLVGSFYFGLQAVKEMYLLRIQTAAQSDINALISSRPIPPRIKPHA